MPLSRTATPGVYERGSRYVVVYREEGRQRKETVGTYAEARARKLAHDAEVRRARRGPTLHAYALEWVERYPGSGHDTVREQTREEYRGLLSTGALTYFAPDVRLGDLDRQALQGFVTWLTGRPGRRGRLSDRSIHNAVTPLRMCLRSAAEEGVLPASPAEHLVLPRRRSAKPYEFEERRFLTREQLCALLDEIPAEWRHSSSCSPPPGCGFRKRSPCACATWSWTRRRRESGFNAQS